MISLVISFLTETILGYLFRFIIKPFGFLKHLNPTKTNYIIYGEKLCCPCGTSPIYSELFIGIDTHRIRCPECKAKVKEYTIGDAYQHWTNYCNMGKEK